MRDERRVSIVLLQVVLLLGFVGFWELASRHRWIDPFFFSQPSVFFARAWRWLTEPGLLLGGRSIYRHLMVTMQEMIGGFVLGVVFDELAEQFKRFYFLATNRG